MSRCTDQSERNLALRYDLTISVVIFFYVKKPGFTPGLIYYTSTVSKREATFAIWRAARRPENMPSASDNPLR